MDGGFRIRTVVDRWSRESVIVEPRIGFRGRDVVDALQGWNSQHHKPTSITVDHGTEFTSKAMEEWAWDNQVKLDFITIFF